MRHREGRAGLEPLLAAARIRKVEGVERRLGLEVI